MTDQVLAVIGVILGAVTATVGLLMSSRRSRRNELLDEIESLQQLRQHLQHFQRQVPQESLSPDTKRRYQELLQEIEEDLEYLHRLASTDIRLGDVERGRSSGAASIHVGARPRTVEVQREDGSRTSLRVDPGDADSVRDFVDDARRIHAERVLAVH